MIKDKHVRELFEKVKSGKLHLTAEDLVLTDASGNAFPIELAAALTCENDRFQFELRFTKGSLPEPLAEYEKNWMRKGGTFTRDDLWNLKGRLSNGLEFVAPEIWPPSRFSKSSVSGVTVPLKSDVLCLPEKRLSPEEAEELQRNFRAIMGEPENDEPTGKEGTEEVAGEPIDVDMMAILPGVESVYSNCSTTVTTEHPFLGKVTEQKNNSFMIERGDYQFCLQPHEDDLYVFLRRRRPIEAPESAVGVNDDDQLFTALLRAVGFTHGAHPWPCYREHKVDGSVKTREVKCYSPLHQIQLRPFRSARIAQDESTHRLIESGTEFFKSGTPLVEQVEKLLWLVRESGKPGIPVEIRMLTYCSAIEGLITTLCDKEPDPAEASAFARVKNKVLTAIESLVERGLAEGADSTERKYWERLPGFVRSWGHLRAREKWKVVCEDLNLPWDGVFEEAFKVFNKYRNPLAHGFTKEQSEDGGELKSLSRLAGAMNILLARIMGHSGRVDISIYESDLGSVEL